MGSKKRYLVDYIFWFLFFVYTNPGAILEAIFNEDRGDGGINLMDFVFVYMFICFVFVYYEKDSIKDLVYSKILIYLICFVSYLFIVFGFLVPEFRETPGASFTTVFIKSRTTIFNIVIFMMVYKFMLRSWKIFLNLYLISSLVIITLFFITVITGFDLLPIEKANRKFVSIPRIFLKEYGIMPLLIPMAAVLISFKSKIKAKHIIMIGGGLMFVVWLLSLTRRHIFGSIIILVITLMFYNYFENKALIPVAKFFNVSIYMAILCVFLYFTFPKYIDAGIKTVEQTIYVLQHGETTTGAEDQRFGFERKFIVDIFKENPLFGTGFDNRWRTAEGGRQGYEASDYPFLAALAMAGIIGVIAFLPIYIILIKTLIFDIRFLKNNTIDYNKTEFFFLMTFIIFFIYSLMQYMNWFSPISIQANHEFYVFLAIYLASRKLFYVKKNENQSTLNTI